MKNCICCLLLLFMVSCVTENDDAHWYKGQLHTHSYWSDGRAFPEQAVQAYQQRGYHFMSLTDHNRFADDPALWRQIQTSEGGWPPNVTRTMFDAYIRDFGEDWVDVKNDGDALSVRLKTYAEIKDKFEVPGEFLLLPGVESTLRCSEGNLHLNYINLPALIPFVQNTSLVHNVGDPDMTVSKQIGLNVSEVSVLADELQRPSLLMINHPFWSYYDILPQDLIDNPEIRFFEVFNGAGSGYLDAPHPDALSYTIEKFWDVINAFRCVNDQQLLYGVGVDDSHFYDADRINGFAGVEHGWVMVRAESLTPETIISAMHKGDFYASSGVYLEDVVFDPEENRLHVRVKPENGVNYRIHFITTKADFDRSVFWIEHSGLARMIPLYSEEIGRKVKTVSGTEASYTLSPDDLYVRARVESDKPSKVVERHFHPKVQTAWTQPYVAGFARH